MFKKKKDGKEKKRQIFCQKKWVKKMEVNVKLNLRKELKVSNAHDMVT
jgi:hypothetical protein